MTSKTAATEPNDLGRYFIEHANAGDVDGLRAVPRDRAGTLARQAHPTLVSGDLALTVSTLTTGEMTVEIARPPAGTRPVAARKRP